MVIVFDAKSSQNPETTRESDGQYVELVYAAKGAEREESAGGSWRALVLTLCFCLRAAPAPRAHEWLWLQLGSHTPM